MAGDDAQQQQPAEREITVGAARLAITEDTAAAPTAHGETRQDGVQETALPKQGMRIPTLPPDAVFDCTVIGGGTAGLYAAFYAGMREMSVKIIDSLGDLGGQVSALYPEKFIYDVGGFPQVKGKDLISGCVQQGLQFGPTVCLGERVERLERTEDDSFALFTDRGMHRSRTVIVAAGVGAFVPRKLPNQPQLDALEGRGIFYFVRDVELFRGKRLLIVGGGDSAMDWALSLSPLAAHTTLIHRRDRWRAHEDTVRRVLASDVDVRTFHEVRDVHVVNGTIRQVTLYDNRTNEEITLPMDVIVLALGFIANIGPIKEWGLEIIDGGIAVDTTMATSIPGVYAAGDVTRYPGKLNLIATGFGEAAIAANFCKSIVDPVSRVFPGHSSEKSDPVAAS